jgi:hypothetical protein
MDRVQIILISHLGEGSSSQPLLTQLSQNEEAECNQLWRGMVGRTLTHISFSRSPRKYGLPTLHPSQSNSTPQLHHGIMSCVKKGAPADSEPECRLYAPWQLQEEPWVDKNKNPLHWMFSPARNYERLISYSRLVAMAWMANTKY